MSIKIYGPRMGSSLRVHWTLAELGTAYEVVAVDFAKSEHKSPPYLKINPAGQVPALTDGDFCLAESLAICSYVIDKAGSELGGRTPQERARVWHWSLWALLNAQPQLATLASPAFTSKPLAADVEAHAKSEAARQPRRARGAPREESLRGGRPLHRRRYQRRELARLRHDVEVRHVALLRDLGVAREGDRSPRVRQGPRLSERPVRGAPVVPHSAPAPAPVLLGVRVW
jgi:glutathione S-transferase